MRCEPVFPVLQLRCDMLYQMVLAIVRTSQSQSTKHQILVLRAYDLGLPVCSWVSAFDQLT